MQASENPLQIQTAGGTCKGTDEIVLTTPALEEGAFRPIVLSDTPAALSAGWRCMELGYSFSWPAFSTPTLTSPSGVDIPLVVDNYVPFLKATVFTCADTPDA